LSSIVLALVPIISGLYKIVGYWFASLHERCTRKRNILQTPDPL
jgi:hypothetical protein